MAHGPKRVSSEGIVGSILSRLNELLLINIFIEASRGAGAQSMTLNASSCWFKPDSTK